jgi:Tfp pilus assembly protein PilN
MRPVNLIPPEQRRGEAAPARAGAASYIVIAVLFAILFAVTGVVLTGNDVSDKKTELASVEAQQAETTARAQALSNFASFQQMKDNRVLTISSLAQSRFDWERVMREVSRVLPESVWLTNLTGSVSPEVNVPGAAETTTRGSIAGPALSMVGCARSQQDVAALIAAVGDIDGVTRVLAEKSEKPTGAVTGDSSGGDCRTRDYIAQFSLVAAFDSVVAGDAATATATPSTAATSTAAPVPATTAPASPTTATTSATDPETSVPEEGEARANVAAGTAKAQRAAGIIGAGDGG